MITGAEALETRRQLKKRGERPAWSFRDPEKKPFPFEAPFHPAEVAHEVFQAWLTFAVWDVARRAHLGVAPDEYRRRLGELMAPMTEVAARNEHAWFRQRRSPAELITATPENRMVGYPYTKYMVSIMDVDMAAAVIVASESAADALGVPRERRATCAVGATRPTRSTWPSTPRCGARRRWRPRPRRRCGARASASTTWPTSTSTAASPAR